MGLSIQVILALLHVFIQHTAPAGGTHTAFIFSKQDETIFQKYILSLKNCTFPGVQKNATKYIHKKGMSILYRPTWEIYGAKQSTKH